MKLPVDFGFSQQNLQDYLDCPRRFELRYLQKLAWPAVRSEPVLELERQMRLGVQFHQMVQQHQLGLPEQTVASQATEFELELWWRNYLAHPLNDLPTRRYPEVSLAAPFQSYRLVAKYDLLAVDPGRSAVIVDWKTNRRPTPPSILRSRVQTRLYPFLLSLAGAHLNDGKAVQPEQILMIYWFTADPERPAAFPYSPAQLEADEQFLTATIKQIEGQESPYPLTDDLDRCLYCNYRSLCLRGVSAGRENGEEVDGEAGSLLPDFDFDQVAEIEF